MKKSILLFVAIALQVSIVTNAQNLPFSDYNQRWVDSVFQKLTPDERIAQLIMVAAYSNRDQAHIDAVSELIRKQKIGGLVFFQGGPTRQVQQTNFYQSISKVPLLVAIDGEWGLGMRLDSTISYPYQMTLGAIQNDSLLYKMGVEVALQCKRMGIQVNFAPVVDVNNNPNNPVINYRSFGENKENVARKSIAYMKGMQDNHILTTAKHFPGHGDTDADSHYDLPLIKKSRTQLDSLELYPFRKIIEAGIGGIMVAHLSIPSLDSTKNQPSTLSKPIISNLLKNELKFSGLAFTDAMNMKGVTKNYTPGVADAKAILAGNDVLEFTEDVPKAIEEIKKAIREKKITQAEIDARCRKVLAAKAWVGLDKWKSISLTNLSKDLNTPKAKLLNRQLTEASLTLLKNENTFLPLQKLDTLQIASVSVGAEKTTAFQRMLAKYTSVQHFTISKQATAADIKKVKDALAKFDLVVVGVHIPSVRPAKNYGITENMQKALTELSSITQKVIICHLGNAYTLPKFDFSKATAIVTTYQDNTIAQELAAQALFGAVSMSGKMPVSVSPVYPLNGGLGMNSIHRLKYTMPEEVGMNSELLERRIDSMANIALTQKATPGCQVLVAKNGKIIFHKTYGYLTYDNQRPTQEDDLYDLASVTKVTTSAPALMRLSDEGKFGLDKTLATYLPEYGNSNKKDIQFRDILTHQARLTAWIAFWKETVKEDGERNHKLFRTDSSKRFPVKIVDNLWLNRKYCKKIYKEINDSPLLQEKKYVYSDLSYYLYPRLVQLQTGKPFETYLKETFYLPIGATHLTYKPLRYYPIDQIVPTEYDSLFRKTLIHGTVHDEGAAMLDGLSGHAGLFGTANDVAKMMQMYLQMGEYGGQRFINEATLKEWTRYNDVNFSRRGIAFDKPDPKSPGLSAAAASSAESFGHSGFTGTFVWVDPKYQLVYVFMSNRVYPTRNNNKLGSLNIRTGVLQTIYEVIQKGEAK
ncbi:glycoside hydrolase family 3 N-terminal domain-containing protein [Xanthocytophaga flava]|uniref:glycoside hydrolase family 3 N-terminal domain-containing protein n=1 Tax=Xanthocytophaga flava TaxID=3048013 RepID=UPI0028D55221|nr:glycoside hydrolase family 3 N-terminal domain-containing protein [Xanthocytophaga flavus]MDJ1468414.1 glycoside hydrolase family 3 N-terminal domain-containing protein [Xanthocytophaga flavus]